MDEVLFWPLRFRHLFDLVGILWDCAAFRHAQAECVALSRTQSRDPCRQCVARVLARENASWHRQHNLSHARQNPDARHFADVGAVLRASPRSSRDGCVDLRIQRGPRRHVRIARDLALLPIAKKDPDCRVSCRSGALEALGHRIPRGSPTHGSDPPRQKHEGKCKSPDPFLDAASSSRAHHQTSSARPEYGIHPELSREASRGLGCLRVLLLQTALPFSPRPRLRALPALRSP